MSSYTLLGHAPARQDKYGDACHLIGTPDIGVLFEGFPQAVLFLDLKCSGADTSLSSAWATQGVCMVVGGLPRRTAGR